MKKPKPSGKKKAPVADLPPKKDPKGGYAKPAASQKYGYRYD